MDNYNKNLYGIEWSEYLKMYPKEGKSKLVSRKMEVTMLQRILDQGMVNKEPVTLDPFWRNIVEEEKWGGNWKQYRDHFRQSVAHRIPNLKFMDSKYRALMIYVSSRSVTDTFKEELAKDECVCHYDENSRIITIVSKDRQVVVGGKRLRKVAMRNNRKTQKKNEKDDEEDENKEEDDEEEEEDDEEKEYQDDDDDEKEGQDEKKEDKLEMNTAMSTGEIYDIMIYELEIHCRKNKVEYPVMLGLEQGSRNKKMSNRQLLKLLGKLTRWVADTADEKTDVSKIEKFQVLKTINLMSGMVPGDDTMKKSIKNALEVECGREENISLELFVLTINAILD